MRKTLSFVMGILFLLSLSIAFTTATPVKNVKVDCDACRVQIVTIVADSLAQGNNGCVAMAAGINYCCSNACEECSSCTDLITQRTDAGCPPIINQ